MMPNRHLALLAGALLLAAACASAAPRPRPAPAKDAPPALADFAKLSGSRPHACDAAPDPRLAAMGQPSARQCAWGGRIEMLYWHAIATPAGACLTPAAIAWQRLATSVQARPDAWNVAWTGRALVAGNGALQQALALWRDGDGAWSAVLWRWQPASRPDTRAWQAAHWQDVVQAVQSAGAGDKPLSSGSPLLQAWLDATAGEPRVLDGDNWRWVTQHACLSMQTAGIAQAQLHLPYSRDDARLEQRSAMQVQLARRIPNAEWLRPFALLDPAVPGTRSSAKFIAVWKEGAAVKGQLWIPLRDDGGVVRARIESSLGAQAGAHGEDAAKGRADLLEHELTALAHAWEARHE